MVGQMAAYNGSKNVAKLAPPAVDESKRQTGTGAMGARTMAAMPRTRQSFGRARALHSQNGVEPQLYRIHGSQEYGIGKRPQAAASLMNQDILTFQRVLRAPLIVV